MNITTNEFSDLWINKLTEQQRKNRSEAAYRIIRPVAAKQLEMLKQIIQKENQDNFRANYLFETVKSLWENIDFGISLGKGKNRKYAFYPARTVLENTFRLEYFTRQGNNTQEEIAIMECLRISKRHYENELANNDHVAAKEFEAYYNKFSQGRFDAIDKVKERIRTVSVDESTD